MNKKMEKILQMQPDMWYISRLGLLTDKEITSKFKRAKARTTYDWWLRAFLLERIMKHDEFWGVAAIEGCNHF